MVLFDLDGTLVDTVELIVASMQHTWRAVLGEELDAGLAKSWIGRSMTSMLEPFGETQAAEMLRVYLEFNHRELPLMQRNYPGVAGLLRELRDAGVVAGVVTSKRRAASQQSLDVAGLDGLIDLVATLEDTEIHKPDPAPLLFALDKLGCRSDGAVYVGDAIVDVRAARAAGMASIAVTWGAGQQSALASERPDLLVTSADELRAALFL